METITLEERVSRIENQFAQLQHQVLDLKPRQKSWRDTVGMLPDDTLSREAEKFGREWREQANQADS